MKVCVYGAGATGGHFASLLTRAGADVSVVVRGAHLEAIRTNGLVLHTDDGPVHTHPRASDQPADLGVQDLVLVTLKSHALPGCAANIGALLGPATPVVFLQNGIPWWYHHGEGAGHDDKRLPAIDPGDALWQSVGPQRVIGGITASACTLERPGVVTVRGGNRTLSLGEPDGSDSARLRETAALFRAAGFPAETTPRIRDAIWSKLAINLGSGVLGVLAPVTLKELYVSDVMVQARLRIQHELAAIAKAMGCPMEVNFESHLAFARNSPHLPSIVQDTLAGRKIEIEAMFLAPLQMARDHGVATPTLDLLVTLCEIKARAAGLY